MFRHPLPSSRISARFARIAGPLALGAFLAGPRWMLAQSPEASPGATPVDATGLQVETAQEILVNFSQAEADGDLYTLVHLFHPDSLREAPGYVVAGWYRDNSLPKGPQPAELTGTPILVPGWTWPVNGQTYPAVAVPFQQHYDDGSTLDSTAMMVPGPAGPFAPYLRFFGDSREFVDEQVKAYYDNLVSAAMQSDFQLVTFPPDAIDLASVLPPTWEDFMLDETGIMEAVEPVEAGQWARYVQTGAADDGTASEIQLSWAKEAVPETTGKTFDYALRAPQRFTSGPAPLDLGWLAEPQVSLVTIMSDDSYVQVQIPEHPMQAGVISERLVFRVLRDDAIWYHMVQVLHTGLEDNVASRFVSSLPYVAV